MLNFKHALTFAFVVGLTCSTAIAQNYYDDDIYYNPAKVKTEKVEQKKTTLSKNKYNPNVTIYQPSDSFRFDSGNRRDIDEYNRRNATVSSSSTTDSLGQFAYTRQIERFYNPEVVSGSKDTDLQEYYYYAQAEQPQTTVNIYLSPNYRWWSPSWYYGWNSPWSWNWWGYDPWLDPWYAGPSWAWNWGWGPSWSWNWGFGPSWGWGPAWGGPSWGWAPALPAPAYRPSVGGMITHRPASSNNRFSPTNRRPGQTVSGTTTNRRPTTGNSSLSGQRPGANRYENNSNAGWSNSQRGGSNVNSGSFGGSRSTGSGMGGHSTSGRRR